MKTTAAQKLGKLFMVMALGLMMTAPVQAAVARANRALVIVSELDSGSVPELRDLYRALEEATRTIPHVLLGGDYAEIHRLTDSQATAANFVSTLRSLAASPDIQAIDVILSLHGSDGRVYFREGGVRVTTLGANLLTVRNKAEAILVSKMKRKLRLMYNLSCFGKSHNAAFIDMGFDTSIGSKKVNANSEVEYPSFLGLWKLSQTVEAAMAPTNNDVAITAHDAPIRFAGQMSGNAMLQQVDSQKVIAGNKNLRITTSPQ